MCENSLLFQHHYFFDDLFSKSFFNNESLQIHNRWYDHDEQFFRTVIHSVVFLSLLKFEILTDNIHNPYNLHNLAHYIGQRTILDYTIVYDETIGYMYSIYVYVLVGTLFSL